nr:MAG TPA: hypothetical protein [Caudoviricetes sp.]
MIPQQKPFHRKRKGGRSYIMKKSSLNKFLLGLGT